MPHISHARVKKEVFLRMNDRFIRSLMDLTERKSARAFFKELLTPTEQIMLAKRLAVILMLQQGFSFYRVERTLKISPSTAARLWRKLHAGEFSGIGALIKRGKSARAFWAEMATIIRAGMPPMGRGRWKWFYEMRDQHEKRNLR